MRRLRFLSTLAMLALVALAIAACYPIQMSTSALAPATAAPVALAPTQTPTVAPTATASPTPLPTATPVPTATPLPTATAAPTALPVATAAQVGALGAAPTAVPTGPQKYVIKEADLQKAIDSGVLKNNGVDASNLKVRMTGGKLYLTADSLNYGLVHLTNLQIVGHLVAKDGVLQAEFESIAPGGLAGAMLPSVINSALRQLASASYVQDVQTTEGQIELTIR